MLNWIAQKNLIIDEGTTDGWSWREYADGRIEAEKTVLNAKPTPDQGSSPVYYANTPLLYTVPSFLSEWTGWVVQTNTTGYNSVHAFAKSTTQIGVRYVQFYGSKGATAQISFVLHLVGKR